MNAISVEKINRNVDKIVTDCEVFYLCDSKWLNKSRLKNDFPIDGELENELREFTERYSVERALKYIEFKRRTEKEVSSHLKKIPVPEGIVRKTIVKMIGYGFLDDELYARDYIDELIEKNQSTYAIKMKSINRGLDESMVEAILSELNACENEYKRALKLIEKKYGKSNGSHDFQKLGQHLYRKGFSTDAIRKSLEYHFGGIDQ